MRGWLLPNLVYALCARISWELVFLWEASLFAAENHDILFMVIYKKPQKEPYNVPLGVG